MRIVMICDNDPAGMAIAAARAVNAHTPHEVRVVSTKTVYRHGWDKDLHVPDLDEAGLELVRDLLASADVFHFHMVIDERHALGPLAPRDYMAGKILVHHHHGHPDFRGNPLKYQKKYADLGRRNLLVSTPDLLKLLPGAVWQPNHVPVREKAYSPLPEKPAAPVTLVHSPTRKDLKNTAELHAAVEALRAAGVAFAYTLIDNLPHAECLALKRRAHLAFDHLQGYFGVSSLETLSMGVPTIAGLDAHNRACLCEYAGVMDLPWVVSSLERLEDDLRALLLDADHRAAVGAASRVFMTDHFDDVRAAGRLAAFWESCA